MKKVIIMAGIWFVMFWAAMIAGSFLMEAYKAIGGVTELNRYFGSAKRAVELWIPMVWVTGSTVLSRDLFADK